jgi:hypothetical protein
MAEEQWDSLLTRWLDSVAQPFLKQWYDDCLSHPDNALLLSMARTHHTDFRADIMSELNSHHDSRAWNGHLTRCSCNERLLSKSLGSLDFIQHTTATACLIARHSARNVEESEDDWHFPAVFLLITLITDLENGNYFANPLGSAVSAFDNTEGAMEVDTSDANAAAESLAHGMPDLSVAAETMRMPNSRTAFSSSDEAQLEDMQAMVSAFRLTGS